MKKFSLLIALVISSAAAALAQDFQDVIYLKNGSVVRGIIIEQTPNEIYKMETTDGSLFVFEWDNVAKITKERVAKQMTKQRKAKNDNSVVGEKRFSFGIKAGMSLATVKGDVDDIMPRVGCVVGFTSEYMISNRVSLGVDILYSQQGYKYDEIYDDGSYNYYYRSNNNLSYLNIPATINCYIANGLALKVGIQPGFILSAKSSYFYGYYEDSYYNFYSEDYDIEIYCNTFDLSIPIGISYNINKNIVVDARYNIGLTNISVDHENTDFRLNNSVFQLTVGLKF